MSFRPLVEADLPALAGWLAEPHVFAWWRESGEMTAVRANYLPALRGEDPTELFVLRVDGRDAGMAQRYRIGDNPHWVAALAPAVGDVAHAAGIDYLIGDASLVGRGIGAIAIRVFTMDTLVRYPDADAVVVACQQDNAASWRALEKAGYTREWAGMLDSEDPSDAGPAFVYRYPR